MNTFQIIKITPFIFAIYTSLTSGLLLFRLYRIGLDHSIKNALKVILVAYGISAFNWFAVLFSIVLPKLSIYLDPFLILGATTAPVVLYHFVILVTKTQLNQKFHPIHYVIPSSLFIFLYILFLNTPYNIKLSANQLLPPGPDAPIYAYLYYIKLFLFFGFNTIYGILGLQRTIAFRRFIRNYSADEERTSFRWLYQFLISMVASFPFGILIFLNPTVPIQSIFAFFVVVGVLIFRDVIITKNLLLGNYELFDIEDPLSIENSNVCNQDLDKNLSTLLSTKLENYMREQKPYLNPKLKINDLCVVLGTNRTYLSQYINCTYGMNFCRYVNRFRLEEVDHLKNTHPKTKLREIDLAQKAGFSDYRGYKRIQEKEKTLFPS